MSTLTTELIRNSDAWSLRLIGSLDTDTSQLMWSEDSSTSLLKEMVQAGVKVLHLDFAKTDSIDSYGLRILLSTHKDFSRENVQIVLQNPNSHLRRLFRIMQFDRIFVIESDN